MYSFCIVLQPTVRRSDSFPAVPLLSKYNTELYWHVIRLPSTCRCNVFRTSIYKDRSSTGMTALLVRQKVDGRMWSGLYSSHGHSPQRLILWVIRTYYNLQLTYYNLQQVSFLFFWILLDSLGQERSRRVGILQWTTGRFALLEFSKLIITLVIHFWRRRYPSAVPRESSDEEQPLSNLAPQGSTNGRSSPEWNTPVSPCHRPGLNGWRSTLYIAGVAGLYALQGQLVCNVSCYSAVLMVLQFVVLES